jgi:hypothetical protein
MHTCSKVNFLTRAFVIEKIGKVYTNLVRLYGSTKKIWQSNLSTWMRKTFHIQTCSSVTAFNGRFNYLVFGDRCRLWSKAIALMARSIAIAAAQQQ